MNNNDNNVPVNDTPRTKAEMNRVYAELDGGEDNALYALEQMGLLSLQLERELNDLIVERNALINSCNEMVDHINQLEEGLQNE